MLFLCVVYALVHADALVCELNHAFHGTVTSLCLVPFLNRDTMADVSNGPTEPLDDATFERDLKEILEDAPNLNDLSSNVQSGSPQKINNSDFGGFNYGSPDDPESAGRLTHSYTVPPGRLKQNVRAYIQNADCCTYIPCKLTSCLQMCVVQRF